MTRVVVALTALVCLAAPVTARTVERKVLPRLPLEAVRPVLAHSGASSPSGELSVTQRTEVILDGRPCAYKDVPAGAAVVRVEVAEDRRTVLRIEFKSPR